MKIGKAQTDAKHVINQLSELSSLLASPKVSKDIDLCFQKPLEIMHETMAFEVSVLYKITNVVDDRLMLKVVRLDDDQGFRTDLARGQRLMLSLSNPPQRFINEVTAFKTRKVSRGNVAGQGCDIVGFIYLPDSFGGGYLFGGDYPGDQSGVKDYEASVCEIMCNYLSTILIKGQFEQLAVMDSLTGLYNSRRIKEEVARICGRFGRKNSSQAVIVLCDIDHFKAVNDAHGHLQGDRVLREMGGLLKNSLRRHFDMAGRYGGEEFLLIFDETDEARAFEIVERIRKKIETHAFTRIDGQGRALADTFLPVTVSFGIALNTADNPVDMAQWISQADQALYRAKKMGRNQTVLFKEESGLIKKNRLRSDPGPGS